MARRTKQCSKCEEIKEISAFGSDKRIKSGLYAQCRTCVALKSQKRRELFQELTDLIKTEAGCVDCGYNKYACALDFDHVKGIKQFCIGHGRRYNIDANLKAELAKCEIRCATCHRVQTRKRGQYGKAD